MSGEVTTLLKYKRKAILDAIKEYQEYLKVLHPHINAELDSRKLKAFKDNLKYTTCEITGESC